MAIYSFYSQQGKRCGWLQLCNVHVHLPYTIIYNFEDWKKIANLADKPIATGIFNLD